MKLKINKNETFKANLENNSLVISIEDEDSYSVTNLNREQVEKLILYLNKIKNEIS